MRKSENTKLLEQNVKNALRARNFDRIDKFFERFGADEITRDSNKTLFEVMATTSCRHGSGNFGTDFDYDRRFKNAWLNQPKNRHTGALVSVAEHYPIDFLKKMMADGYELDRRDDGDNILHVLARRRDEEAFVDFFIDVLTKHPEFANEIGSDGYSPLDISICSGKSKSLFALFDTGGKFSGNPLEPLFNTFSGRKSKDFTTLIEQWWNSGRWSHRDDNSEHIISFCERFGLSDHGVDRFCIELASIKQSKSSLTLCKLVGKEKAVRVYPTHEDSEMSLLDACLYSSCRSGDSEGAELFMKEGANPFSGTRENHAGKFFNGKRANEFSIAVLRGLGYAAFSQNFPTNGAISPHKTIFDWLLSDIAKKPYDCELSSIIESALLVKREANKQTNPLPKVPKRDANII